MSEIKSFEQVIGEMAASSPEIAKLFAPVTSPAYTYWEDKKGNRYFYTKKKINHKGKPRYVAGIYRYLKTKEQFKLVKTVGFAKKKKAIEWAREKSQLQESTGNSEV